MAGDTRKKDIQLPPGMGRFLRLGKMIGDDSRELAVKLTHLIRGYGIYKIKPSKDESSKNIQFISAVHEGWKLAQNLIAEKLIENLRCIEGLEKEKNAYHRQHLQYKKNEAISSIRKLKLENIIFRRFVDAIVWVMLDHEHSTIRRLPIGMSGDNLSIKNIQDTKPVVDEINYCRLTIAIVCDITTFVHHGDIIVRSPSGIEFIELKSGKKNREISKAAELAQRIKCAIAGEILARNFNVKDKSQFIRARNQMRRGENLSRTLTTGDGIDQLTGQNVHIGETQVELEFYSDELVDCRKRLEENGSWAISVIDNCLYIGLYKQPEFAYAGFSAWMHDIECKSKVHNITDSFFDPLARPLLSLDLPTEIILEILRGDIIMIACLDIEKFFTLSQMIYPNMLKLTRPDSLPSVGDMLVKGKAMAMTIRNGNGKGVGYLGDGLITRMVYDLQTPSSILKMQYASSDLYYYIN